MKKELTIVLTNLVILIVIGTFIFHHIEGWDWIDSFYFTSITLSTIGYGDLVPTTPLSKIFTVFFAFSGIGLVIYSFTLFSKRLFTKKIIFEPKSWAKKTFRVIVKDVMKEEEEKIKYELKKLIKNGNKQNYNYKKKKNKK